ncbi:MAG: ABC transporter permease [Treponema sp.]|nr:ABC transporter permease [Treponema sp.]
MIRYIGERLFQLVLIMFGVSVIVFFLVNRIPGNPYASMFSPDIPSDQVEAKLREVGYYDPLPLKYVKWVSRIAVGDFGYSIFYRDKVSSIIFNRMLNTLLLTVSSLVISMAVGISAGIYTGRKPRSLADNSISVLTFLLLSIPSFFFGMLMIKFLGADLRLLPISGMITVSANYRGLDHALDVIRHMIMPSFILGLLYSATMLRYTRSSVIGIINADFIRSARAHGLTERVILFKHLLKNILIPIVTVLSLQIPDMLSGALLIETVFVWPGVGRLSFEAVQHRDYPLIMGILLVMALITLISNLIADVAYALIDQRITLGAENVRTG